MFTNPVHYDIDELANLSGSSIRKIRYYIQQKLLPPPSPPMGPDARYGEKHLARLELIRQLQSDYTLSEIRQRLKSGAPAAAITNHLTETSRAADYARAVLQNLPRLAPDNKAPPPPSRPPGQEIRDRTHWERISLTSHIEIHVRRPLSPTDIERVERLLTEAQRLFNEEER